MRPQLVLLSLLALAGPLAAQQGSDTLLVRGAKARLTARSEGMVREVVTVRGVSADSLLAVRKWAGQPLPSAVALQAIERLEVSLGREPQESRAAHMGGVIGMAVGAGLGGIVGYATWSPCTSHEMFGCWLYPSRSVQTVGVALLGTCAGYLVGLVAGGASARGRWVDVRPGGLHPAAMVTPSGRLGFGAALSF